MLSKTLLKKSGIYLIGNLSSKVLSVLLIPIYAFYITAEDLGLFDFSQTLMSILAPFILLAIWEAVLKFLLSEDDDSIKRKVITSSFYFTIIISMLFGILAIIFGLLYEGSSIYILLTSFMIVLHAFVSYAQYTARASGANKLFVVSGILSTLVNFIFVIIFVVILDLGVFGLLLSYNMGQLSIIVMIERKLNIVKNTSLKYFDIVILKKMLMFSSPLVINLISAWAISGFGRFFITLNLGIEANGIFTFALKLSMLIAVLGSVITMALTEEAIIKAKNKTLKDDLNLTIESLFKMFQNLSISFVPMTVIFYLIISQTVYYQALYITPLLILYAVINTMGINLGSVFQAIDKTRYIFSTTFISGLITVILIVTMTKHYGIYAVAIAQIVGASIMVYLRYKVINKFITFKINWKPIYIKFIVYIVVVLISINSNVYINVIMVLFIIIYFIVKNKVMIGSLLKRIKK